MTSHIMPDISPDMAVFTYDTLDSTQEEAKRLVASGDIPHRAIVMARCQTAGRGTNGRVWESAPDAGLYMTAVWHNLATHEPSFCLSPYYTQATALGCVEALKMLYGLSLQIKPVNDLMADGKKLGGILLESVSSGSQLETIFTGIGLNFADVPLPAWAGYEAIGLQSLLSPVQLAQTSRQHVAQAIVAGVHQEYVRLNADGEAALQERLQPLLMT